MRFAKKKKSENQNACSKWCKWKEKGMVVVIGVKPWLIIKAIKQIENEG